MNGIRGYKAWRWVFIIEGLLTVVVSFLFFFVIPDFPENSKFLTERERAFVKRRIEEDQGKAALERPIRFRDVINVFKDYKVRPGNPGCNDECSLTPGHCGGLHVFRTYRSCIR